MVSIETMRAWACGLRLTLPAQHAGHDQVGAERGAAGDLVDAVGPDRPGADDLQLGLLATSFMTAVLPSHLRGRIQHGADDLVVAGAAAEVAGQPVARLVFGRVRVGVEQRLGGDQQARRAEAALQGRVLEELLLQRMQSPPSAMPSMVSIRRPSASARQHQAGADQAAVDDDAAGAAVARAAAFLGAGQAQLVAQRVEQRLRGSVRNSAGSPLTVVGDVMLCSSSVPPRRAR